MQPNFSTLKPVEGQPNFGSLKPVQETQVALQPPRSLSESIFSNLGIVKDFGTAKEAFQSGIEQVKTGYQQAELGNNPLTAFKGATNIGAGAINTIFSPLAPVFKPISEAINYVGEKIGGTQTAQDIAQSKYGNTIANTAEVAGNLSTIAGGVAGIQELPGQLKTAQRFAGDVNELRKNTQAKITGNTPEQIINKRIGVLKEIDSQYAKMRNKGAYDTNHEATLKRVASTDVLADAVDENGVVRTKQPGGAVEQYTAQTLDGAENVIRKNLERTGEVVSPDSLSATLKSKIESNPQLQGKAKTIALKNVDAEVAGYTRDANGNIPLTAIQDAKVATYKVVKDYATPVEYKTYQKALGEGLKTAIEDNSLINIAEVNAEIGKYLQDISFLERLDGTRVKGAKLGKYFAQVSGNIIGGAVGSAIGGPVGPAVGTILGGEVAGRVKGNALQKSLSGKTGYVEPKNPIIEKAIQTGNSPRLGLPAPAEGAPRVQINSGATINLGSKTQSLADKIYENNLGNRNQQYSPTNPTANNVISPNPTTPKPTVKPVINSESSLLQEAKKGEYLYHGTGGSSLDNIIKEGLKPGRRGQLSLSKDEAYSKSYAQDGMTPNGKTEGALLRVKSDFLKGKTTTERLDGKTRPMSDQINELLTKETIPPEQLEIYKNGKWQSLKTDPLLSEAKKYKSADFNPSTSYLKRNIEVLNKNGIKVKNPDEVITLYHGTNEAGVKGITESGSLKPSSFLATDPNASKSFVFGKGGKVLKIKVRVKDLGFVQDGGMAGSKGVSVQTIDKLVKGKDGIYKAEISK